MEPIGRNEAMAFMAAVDDGVEALLARAAAVRRAVFGSSVRLCAIANAKSGRCPERCDFCAQSAHFGTGVPVFPLKDADTLVAEARRAAEAGAREFSIVTAGRALTEEREIAVVEEAVRRIGAETGIEVCASLGEVSAAVLARLRAAGLTRYHHNIETAPSFHGQVVRTHGYEDEVRVIDEAKKAGLKVCCGGIFGMGETRAQRVEMAFALRELDPDCIPLNFLDPRPGTPLDGKGDLTPIECLKIIAVFRLVMPRTHLFVCGGRARNLGAMQARIFEAGANGMMVGDYLTTAGEPESGDRRMIREGGWQVEGKAPPCRSFEAIVASRNVAWDAAGLDRKEVALGPRAGAVATADGRRLIDICSNDYLGLATHPALAHAEAEAAVGWGAGSGASRLVSGTRLLHIRLEETIAQFLGAGAVALFGSGYLANLGLLSALTVEGGVVYSDEMNHASIVDGCRLGRARVEIYRHCDVDHLRELIAARAGDEGPRIVITESIFSMDGDAAPLAAICDVAAGAGAWVLVDEAHAFGVAGPGGRGLAHDLARAGRIHARMGTLGKAAGAFGAFVAGSAALTAYLRNRARPYMFSTALPPGVAAAATAGVGIIASGEGERLRGRLAENAGALRAALAAGGWPTAGGDGAIIPVVVGDGARAIDLADRLLSRGVLVRAIRHPAVPRGTERLRFVASAALTDEQIRAVAAALAAVVKEAE